MNVVLQSTFQVKTRCRKTSIRVTYLYRQAAKIVQCRLTLPETPFKRAERPSSDNNTLCLDACKYYSYLSVSDIRQDKRGLARKAMLFYSCSNRRTLLCSNTCSTFALLTPNNLSALPESILLRCQKLKSILSALSKLWHKPLAPSPGPCKGSRCREGCAWRMRGTIAAEKPTMCK